MAKLKSPESIEKQRESLKRAWAEGKYANRPSLKGIKRNEEVKRKLSEAARRPNHVNPFVKGHTFNPKGIHRSPATEFKKGDPRIPAIARMGRMKQMFPNKASSIEIAMRTALDKRGLHYETNRSILGICQPDIVFPEEKVAIFCDGDYWHHLPSYIVRDAYQNEALTNAGWRVLRFWEHKIRHDVEGCIDKVMGVVS